MKNLTTIILAAVIITASTSYAQSPDQLFFGANQLYQQGKFAEARDAYEEVLKGGYESGSLYYNLGNTYYKLGNIAKAIVNYERARKLIPNDDDVLHNLQLANLMITDKIEPAPRLFVWEYWDAIKGISSLNGLTWATYFFFVFLAGSISAAVVVRSYRARKFSIFSATGSALVFAICLFILVAKVSEYQRQDMAVVTVTIATIKNSPDQRSSDAFVLHGGVKVQITDAVNEWIKIRLADGKVGWMENTAAEII